MFQNMPNAGSAGEMAALAAPQAAEPISLPHFQPSDLGWLPILKALLDERPFPTVLMQDDLSVKLANRAALREAGAGFVLHAGGVFALHPCCQKMLASSLRESRAKRPEFPKIIPYDPPANFRKMLVIAPLEIASADGSIAQSSPAKSWFIVSLKSGAVDVPPDCIGRALGLTRAESALAAGLAQGLTLQEYAVRHDLKISTVRWHLQNIFERTETRSQAELVGLIVSLFA